MIDAGEILLLGLHGMGRANLDALVAFLAYLVVDLYLVLHPYAGQPFVDHHAETGVGNETDGHLELRQHLQLADLGTPEELITTVIDTSALLEIRERAIAIHRSQTSPYEVMPAGLRREFLATERLQRVHPQWTGGPIETDMFANAGSDHS